MREKRRPRVLALHGAGATPEIWSLVEEAAPDLELLAPDLMKLARAVDGSRRALIEALGAFLPPGPGVVVGATGGGNLALEVAALRPDPRIGVLLLNPHPLRPTQAFRRRIRDLQLELARGISEAEARSWANLLVHPQSPEFGRARELIARLARHLPLIGDATVLKGLAPSDTEAAFRAVRDRVWALLGNGSVLPLDDCPVDEWLELLEPDRRDCLEPSSHWLPLEHPERIAAQLRKILHGLVHRP